MNTCAVQYQDALIPFVKSEVWSDPEDNEGDWSTNFFRWVVDEASSHLDYEDVLFSNVAEIDASSFTYTCTSEYNEGKFEPYDEQTVPAADDSKQTHPDYEESPHYDTIAHRGPGRPRSLIANKKLTNRKTGKLWEFLRNLLLDERTCPSLIKWDNYNEGTFKFVQSEKVAQLWGNRKNNTKMNYEKLSRAMRYYYRSQVLLPVAGKRLVYKFGPQATGWRTPNPIL